MENNEIVNTRGDAVMLPKAPRLAGAICRSAVSSFLPPSPRLIRQLLFVLTLGSALSFPALAAAQPSPPVMDKEKVRVGLPSGVPNVGRMRQGAWAPVYIPLTAGPNGNSQQQFKIVLEAVDAEENPYRYSVAVPALNTGSREVVVGYLRAPNQEFTIALQTVEGKTLQGPIKHPRAAEPEALIMPGFLVMGGAKLPKLKAALQVDEAKAKGGPQGEEVKPPDAEDDNTFARSYARIDEVEDMPDRWFGYEAADVVILTTDKRDFITKLNSRTYASRRRALAEWVRRGGRLVISVAHNRQDVNELLQNMPFLSTDDRQPLLPFEFDTGNVHRKILPSINEWIGVFQSIPALGEPGKDGKAAADIEIVKLPAGLGDGARALVTENADAKDASPRPLIVQSSCGLGWVLLIAFEVDAEPFNSWDGQKSFWIKIRDFSGMNLPEIKKVVNNFTERSDPELRTELEHYIDTFEDVPVVSFGWVALFIFVYILVVGPLDYFILKKVFKRLELTWVTFPTVVVTISVGAYFIAYALKGEDLRVNKVDLVDIDLHTPQVYGTSWFSVFSPRMQNYTLGVEPAFKGATKGSTTVAVLENPAAVARGGSTSLFRQPYEYAEDASGLERVPIPVWSTRMFTASWRTPYLASNPPFQADLKMQNGIVTGKIINNLPVNLEDVCLLYQDKVYKLPKDRMLAAKGDLFEVSELAMGNGNAGTPITMDEWLRNSTLDVNRTLQFGSARRHAGEFVTDKVPSWNQKKKEIMFYRRKLNALNSGLRMIDENWRLLPPYRDEVILVARTAYASGRAKQINEEGLVQLWNDQLPGTADRCPDLTGYLNQETYIRVYIPVKNP